MEDLRKEKFLSEVRDRISDAMAAVQLLTPLVREKGDGRDREYLAAMTKSFYRLLRLIHHMEVCQQETLSRPEALDLAGLCRDVCDQCMPMAKKLDISFDWTLSDSSVLSMGSDHLLSVALLNILTNAFEAAGPGGHVSLGGARENGYWKVTVTDDGPGLRKPEQVRDPFLKQPGGVGLGLEAVRKVAGLHGGVLLLEDRKGSTPEGETDSGVRAVLALPVQKPTGGEILREPRIRMDFRGGFSPILVEFSTLLPLDEFSIEDTE